MSLQTHDFCFSLRSVMLSTAVYIYPTANASFVSLHSEVCTLPLTTVRHRHGSPMADWCHAIIVDAVVCLQRTQCAMYSIYWHVTLYTGMSPYILACHLIYWQVTLYTGMSPYILACHLIYWHVTLYTGMSPYILACHLLKTMLLNA